MAKRTRYADWLLGALGIGVGMVSLFYPFGADQGLFFYTSREWLLRGRVPYRDVFDHKGPFIYVIHALIIAVLGENEWGVRLAELALVALVAWLGASLATPRGRPVAPGAWGAAWLATSLLYFGYFDFWNTAQCEIWYSALALASLCVIVRARHPSSRRISAAGALGALAVFIKPVALCFVLVTLGALVARQREPRPAVRGVIAYAIGGAAVAAAILAYFAATDALRPMIDVLVGANGHYLAGERTAGSAHAVLASTLQALRWFDPLPATFFVLTTAAIVTGVARRNGRLVARYALPLALVLAGYATVVVQLKFYPYHWATALPGCAVFGATLYTDVRAVLAPRVRPAALALGYAASLAGLFVLSDDPADWGPANLRALRWLSGSMSRAQYASSFDVPRLYFPRGESETIGLWLRERVGPSDTVAVRGFEAQIYAICRCRYSGRFYWTTFLTEPGRAYRRDEWLAEDAAEIARHPPRFVVAPTEVHDGIDAPEWFEARGYRRVLVLPVLTVLGRGQT